MLYVHYILAVIYSTTIFTLTCKRQLNFPHSILHILPLVVYFNITACMTIICVQFKCTINTCSFYMYTHQVYSCTIVCFALLKLRFSVIKGFIRTVAHVCLSNQDVIIIYP